MKNEEAKRIAIGLRTDFKCESDTMVDFCNTIIKVLEQEPCEDCVSRQAVLEQTYSWSKDEFLRVTNPFDYLRKRINSISPVTPEPKTGHWIYIGQSEINGLKICKCSECGKRTYGSLDYCGNCGAKMVEPQESEET